MLQISISEIDQYQSKTINHNNMKIIILLIALIKLCHSKLITSSAEKHHVQTGSAVSSFSSDTPYKQIFKYQITFQKAFQTATYDIVNSIHSLDNCPVTNIQYFWSRELTNPLIKSQTQITIFGTSRLSFIGTNYKFKINYFAYSPTNPYIETHSNQFFSLTNPAIHLQTFSMTGLTDSSYFIGCFLVTLACIDANGVSPFIFNYTCNAIDSVTVQSKIYVPLPILNDVNCGGGYYIGYSIIIIHPDIYVQIYSGMIHATYPIYPPTINFNKSQTRSFFIGLRSFKTNNACLRFGLTSDSRQISASSDFIQLDYQYFQVLFGPTANLKKINSSPFEKIVQMIIHGLPSTTVAAPSDVELDNSLNYTVYNQGSLTAQVLGVIPQSETDVGFKVSNNTFTFQTKFKLKILTINHITLNTFDHSVDLKFINLDPSSSLNSFNCASSIIKKKDHKPIDSSTSNLKIIYLASLGAFSIAYFSSSQDILFEVYLLIPQVSRTKSSFASLDCELWFQKIVKANSLTNSRFSWISTNVDNTNFLPLNSEGVVKASFDRRIGQPTALEIRYLPDSNADFQTNFKILLPIIRNIKTSTIDNTAKISVVNLLSPDRADKSDFSGSLSSKIKFIEVSDNLVTLVVDTQQSVEGALFDLLYTEKGFTEIAEITDLRFQVMRTITSEKHKNTVVITLANLDNLTPSDLPDIHISHPSISIEKVDVSGSDIKILCSYTKTIEANIIVISYKPNNKDVYTESIAIKADADIPLVYCTVTDQLIERARIIQIVSYCLTAVYLLVFLLSIFSCNKMYGIELMFILNLARYSLIPINAYCPPFSGLSGLRFSGGLNPLFSSQKQISTLSNYFILGIQSNFLSNVNLMLIPLLLVFWLYFPLNAIGKKSDNYNTKPRCLRYGKAFLCEVPLTILLFNSFNIYSSLIVEIQYLKTTDPLSLAVSVISALLLPIAAVLFIFYGGHFSEFNKQFNIYSRSCGISKQTTVALRKKYPLVLIFEMTTIPIILAIQPLFASSLYVVLALEILILISVIVIPLYSKSSDNFRNYVHRGIVLSIIALQILILRTKKDEIQQSSFVNMLPFALLLLLFLGLLCNGCYAVFKSVEFWRSPDLVDVEMRTRQEGPKKKPIDLNPPPRDSSFWYPRQWHGYKEMKETKNDNLLQKEQQVYLKPSQKIQKWFDEIETKNLFGVLGISKSEYIKLKKCDLCLIEKEYAVKSFLQGTRLMQILIDQSKMINTLEQFLRFIGPRYVDNLRECNIERNEKEKK